MAANVQGMDTEQAREVSQNMNQQAGQVAGVVSGISSMLAGVNWTGPDAANFTNDWNGSFAPQAQNASASLEESSAVLRNHADRQDEISA
jgi:uncharacterized protein YukE